MSIRSIPTRLTFSSASLAVALSLASSLGADTITLSNGDLIDDCTIIDETLAEITYKEGGRGKARSVDSSEVYRVEFERGPHALDDASAAVTAGDPDLAIDVLETYLEGHLSGADVEKRFDWGPAVANFRLIGLYNDTGNLGGILDSAKRLIDKFPDSRYVPMAHMAKAEVMFEMGDEAGANKALDVFAKLIESARLSRRWELECDLNRILFNRENQGAARRDELEKLKRSAGSEFPGVASRAALGIGQSFLNDAKLKENDASLISKARDVFEAVIDDPLSDRDVLGGAHAGVGECLFVSYASEKRTELLDEAIEHFMRVVVVYTDSAGTVAQSMFLAGLSYKLRGKEGDQDRMKKLFGRLLSRYPDSEWASQARSQFR